MSMPCPNCQAALSFNELQSGWCDSCGKAIPAFVRSGDHAAEPPKGHRVLPEPGDVRPGGITPANAPMTGGQKALAGCAIIAVLVTVGSAIMGDAKSQGLFIGIGIMILALTILSILSWAVRNLRS